MCVIVCVAGSCLLGYTSEECIRPWVQFVPLAASAVSIDAQDGGVDDNEDHGDEDDGVEDDDDADGDTDVDENEGSEHH